MPEDLKHAGTTFCRMMKAILKDQIDMNVFTHVDDKVVASKRKCTHIEDLAETFTNMREAQLKLNLDKCVFGVHMGKVLGCMVSCNILNIKFRGGGGISKLSNKIHQNQIESVVFHAAAFLLHSIVVLSSNQLEIHSNFSRFKFKSKI
jgi:hypothetical protein